MNVIEINNLTKTYGKSRGITDVSFTVEEGEIFGFIGPNGAGKTTLFNLLTGVYVPTEGSILLNNKKLNGLPPYKITQKGISRTFQNIRLFNDLSVLDNVMIAYHTLAKHSILTSILRLPFHFSGEKEMEEKAIEFLKVFHLLVL